MNKVLKGIGISLAAIAGAALITEAVIVAIAVKELSNELELDFDEVFK